MVKSSLAASSELVLLQIQQSVACLLHVERAFYTCKSWLLPYSLAKSHRSTENVQGYLHWGMQCRTLRSTSHISCGLEGHLSNHASSQVRKCRLQQSDEGMCNCCNAAWGGVDQLRAMLKSDSNLCNTL
jgi:hypothetical protein